MNFISQNSDTIYGPDNYPFGSRKRFKLIRNDKDETTIYPESLYTTQVTGFRARFFIIPKWFKACTNKYFP